MNIIEKQKLFDEYMARIDSIGKIKSKSEQLRAMLEMENFLVSIYNRGFDKGQEVGFEKGLNQSIDLLKN